MGAACLGDRPAAHAERGAADACTFTPGDARLDSNRVAGLKRSITIASLRRECPASRVDSVEVGGMYSPGLTLKGNGFEISAVQSDYDAYTDTLHGSEPGDFWAATGDSLRFPDGVLIPKTVGAWRRLDSAGVVIVDHHDDSRGSTIIRCRYPLLHGVVNNVWPPFAKTGVVPLSRVSPTDTEPVWRVEVDRSDAAALDSLCR